MKIRLNKTEDCDNLTIHQVFVDDKKIAHISPFTDCPEDAIIGRDLLDGNDVIKFIKMGYEAAKRGEDIETIITNEEEN